MKLKYHLNSDGKKVYTLKERSPQGKQTKGAHYKYVKIKNVKNNSE